MITCAALNRSRASSVEGALNSATMSFMDIMVSAPAAMCLVAASDSAAELLVCIAEPSVVCVGAPARSLQPNPFALKIKVRCVLLLLLLLLLS